MKNVELVRYDPQAFDEAEEDWGLRKLFEENHDGTICSQYWSAEEGSSEESGGRNTSTSSEASSGRSTRTGSLLRFNRVLYSTTTTETDEDIELGGDPSQPLPPWTTRASERLWQLLSLLQTLAVRGGQFGVAAAGCLFHSAGHLLMWSLQHQWDAVIRGITASVLLILIIIGAELLGEFFDDEEEGTSKNPFLADPDHQDSNPPIIFNFK